MFAKKTFYRFVNLLIVLSLALNANAVVHASTTGCSSTGTRNNF